MACVKISVLFVSVLALCSADKCKDSPSPLTCHGARVVREALRQLAPVESAHVLHLTDGVEVVEVAPEGSARANGGRSIPQDESLLSRMARYLESHELKIKLNNLMPDPQLKEFIDDTFKNFEQDKSVGEARKKDKGGSGMVLVMGMMMAKMMAALGFGGIAAIAAKALGVAMMALMLSAIIGVKKLSEHGGDDGGHHVSYVSIPHHGEHHRRRREAGGDAYAYRAWRQMYEPKNAHYVHRNV